MPVRTNGRTDGRTDGRTGGRADGRTDVRTDGRTDGRTCGQMDERTDGRTGGRTDGRPAGQPCAHRVRVRAVLVLGAVARVAERLRAAGELADVRLLAGVRPKVRLQVLEARVRLVAALELQAK